MVTPVQATAESHDHHGRKITFTVDGERIATDKERLTPNEILVLAQIDPATHYLEKIDGRHHTSYQGHGDEPIRMHDGDRFVSLCTGPTPTS